MIKEKAVTFLNEKGYNAVLENGVVTVIYKPGTNLQVFISEVKNVLHMNDAKDGAKEYHAAIGFRPQNKKNSEIEKQQ